MKKLFIAITAVFFAASCSTDSDSGVALGNYHPGVFILNEGGLGTVSFLSADGSRLNHDIFTAENPSAESAGLYLQSMFFDGDRAFIISNGSNKITVVNRYTFEYIGAMTSGLATPRYGAVWNGKAYITNTNSYMDDHDDFVTVIDLESLTVTSTIAMNGHAERILAHDGKIYVSGGYYGNGESVRVVCADTQAIVNTISLGLAPLNFAVAGNTLHVLCSTFETSGKIATVNLNTMQVDSEMALPESIGSVQQFAIDGGQYYFSALGDIYRFPIGITSVSDTPWFSLPDATFYTGYGFAVRHGEVFIAEAATDFISNGKFFIIGANAQLKAQYSAGLGPNGFYFND